MEAAGLHNSYPRRVIPGDLRVWLEQVYLFGICPFCRKRSGDLKIFRLVADVVELNATLASSICFRLGTVGRYCVTKDTVRLPSLHFWVSSV